MKSSSFDENFLPIPTKKCKKNGAISAKWHTTEKAWMVMSILLHELYRLRILGKVLVNHKVT